MVISSNQYFIGENMQFSDPRKMAILESLESPYDFSAYLSACLDKGYGVTGDEIEFAQKVGMVMYAKRKFPESTLLEAYLLFVAKANPIESPKSGCGGCGGGKVR